jgi:hypothetical protein
VTERKADFALGELNALELFRLPTAIPTTLVRFAESATPQLEFVAFSHNVLLSIRAKQSGCVVATTTFRALSLRVTLATVVSTSTLLRTAMLSSLRSITHDRPPAVV